MHYFTVDVRLTSVNIALLVLGVILLCVATAGFVVLLLKSDIGTYVHMYT